MKKMLLVISIGILFLSCSSKYQPTWDSVKQHETPDWFRDAKFGIYCHWGPYGVPDSTVDWYSHWMYVEDHPIRKYHERTYGPVSEFGYKDLIPLFTADKFDAEEWAELIQKSGAQFAGPVTEHADGFAMWDSDVTRWNAKDMGPQRDIVGELSQALRRRNIRFIATFHHMWKYAWYPTWDENTDCADSQYADLYGPKVPPEAWGMAGRPPEPLPDQAFNNDFLARIQEVISKYQPDMLYFDNKLNILSEETRLNMLSSYYNHADKHQKDVLVTYKFHDLEKGSAVLDLERARMSELKDFPWLTDDSMDWHAWHHTAEPDIKSANRLIDFLVDVVSKNGCVLLNMIAESNGEIPDEVRQRLLEMGEWLSLNGEAIYGTRPFAVYGEGPSEVVEGHLSEINNPDATARDIRFTTKGGTLYAILLDWPEASEFTIRSLGTPQISLKNIESVKLIGSDEAIQFRRHEKGLTIQTPHRKPCKHAFVFAVN